MTNSTNDRGIIRTDEQEAAHVRRLAARIKRTEAKRHAEQDADACDWCGEATPATNLFQHSAPAGRDDGEVWFCQRCVNEN